MSVFRRPLGKARKQRHIRPGYANYSAYDKAYAAQTITALDMVAYILAQYATIEEVKQGLAQVRVVPVVEKAIGIPVDAHWMVIEPSGKSMVIEYLKGALTFFDNPLGVITNAPSYDWHMTNLRIYVNLSAVALPAKKIEAMDLAGKKLYFHTQHNRRVRMVDCNKLDFTKKEIVHLALDEKKHPIF